ncbi:MAG: hypothetical protein LBR81_05055 [Prevotellaceae bacterium]|jgi:hypothetical protein|nr:hypothetical protein [Prevotellaceae bacterium]
MTENQRFKELILYLISNKKIRNQQQFVEEIDSDKTSVSKIKNGRLSIPNTWFAKIKDAYPYISIDWLKNEEGEMLLPETRHENAEELREKYIAELEHNSSLSKKLIAALEKSNSLLEKIELLPDNELKKECIAGISAIKSVLMGAE